MTLGGWLDAAVDADVEACDRVGGDVGEHGVGRLQPAKVAVAVAERAIGLVAHDKMQLLGLGDGKRAEQDRVDQRVDGGVGADPKRQRDHDHRREAGILAKLPHGVSEIGSGRLDYRDAAGIPARLLDLFEPAERRRARRRAS